MKKIIDRRKEKRRLKREELKKKRQQRHLLKRKYKHDSIRSEIKNTKNISTSEVNKIEKVPIQSKNETIIEDAKFRDPMIESEELEIKRLEKLLGINGSKEKKINMKLHKEFSELDGLGDEFGNFLDNLDDILEPIQKKSKTEKLNLFVGESNQKDTNLGEISNSFSSDNEKAQKSSLIEEESSVHSINAESSEDVDATYKPIHGQDIYGRPTDKNENIKEKKIYIPPHLRANSDNTTNCDSSKLRRIINGFLNRMGEDNIDPTVRSISSIYSKNSTRDVNNILFETIFSVCVHETQIMKQLIISHAALIAALNINVGKEVGTYFLERLTNNLNDSMTDTGKTSGNKSTGKKGYLSNMVLLLAYFFIFGMVYAGLMYDFIRLLIESFSEVEVELLLLLLQIAGQQLRTEDLTSFNEIINQIKSKAAEHLLNQSNTDLTANNSKRLQFILETLSKLKSKRKEKEVDNRERVVRLRKYLGSIKSSKGGYSGETFLRLSWSDLTSDVGKRGRWWLVGSAWSGADENNRAVPQNLSHEKHSLEINNDFTAGFKKLEKLSAYKRMNTSVRKSIFCAIMSATDFEDGFEKLMSLSLYGNQDREIARVLLDCCGSEKSYNPYYSWLGSRLCEFESKYRFTFQLAFWDIFKKFEQLSSRFSANVARLLSNLILNKNQSIAMLKAIDMNTLPPPGLLFLKVLLHTLFSEPDDEKFIDVFHRLTAGKRSNDRSLACGTIAVMVQKYLQSISSKSSDEEKILRKRGKKVIRILDMLPSFSEIEED